jgi:hypothetical protein
MPGGSGVAGASAVVGPEEVLLTASDILAEYHKKSGKSKYLPMVNYEYY